MTCDGWRFGLPHKGSQLPKRGGAVLSLAARRPRHDDDFARVRCAPSSEQKQARTDVVRQAGRLSGIEAQLHGSLHFVHILPARPRTAHELFVDFVVFESQRLGYLYHKPGSFTFKAHLPHTWTVAGVTLFHRCGHTGA